MEKDYKKFSMYDILMLIIYAAGLYASSYEGKIYLLILAAVIDLILLYLQRQIIKPYGIDYNKLIPGLQSFLLILVFVLSTTFANFYSWTIWIGVLAFALMLYKINKAVKEKLLIIHN